MGRLELLGSDGSLALDARFAERVDAAGRGDATLTSADEHSTP